MSVNRAASAPCDSRYRATTACCRRSSGPTSTASSGTPSSTTTASSTEMDSSSAATAMQAATAPIPGPTQVSARPAIATSETPMVTTSPAVTRRDSTAPSRTACPTITRTVRNQASSRSRVSVRCREMLSQALSVPEASSAAHQPRSAPVCPDSSPSSMARESR